VSGFRETTALASNRLSIVGCVVWPKDGLYNNPAPEIIERLL
jgi:hypothetical protein